MAPKSKADFAFVLHSLSYLSSKGRAAIVCFPGIFYRAGAEKKIRQYLVDNNYVETVISLAPNLFYGTTIAVNILVLSKSKIDTNIQFIDASSERFYKKETNNNILTDDHVKELMDLFDTKKNVEHLSKLVPYEDIVEKEYNLAVGTYIESKDTRESINIDDLNNELKDTILQIDKLRNDLNSVISEIEGVEID